MSNEEVNTQDEYDDDHYTIANPEDCKTKQFGVINDKIGANKDQKEVKSKKPKRKIIAAAVLVAFIAAVAAGIVMYLELVQGILIARKITSYVSNKQMLEV